jgi:pimeloyl-ACP methyl ester carboxylesterase
MRVPAFTKPAIAAALIVLSAIALTARPASADDFDSAGVKIHYVQAGKGDPVILVHGLYSSAWMNWQMPGTFRELAKDHLVIAFDSRGHGQSGKPTAEDQYGTQMAEDVVRLMDHLHIAKAQVVGYSMGGMIVMKLLALHPDRVSAAVLGGMGWLREGGVIDRFWAGMRGDRGSVPPACLRGFSKLALTQAEVKAIKVPIIVIVGDRDPCYKLYVRPLINLRPDTPVIMVNGAGHFDCIVKPDFQKDLAAALLRK